MSAPFRILVLCTGNSARSQIAEALLATRGARRIEAGSAGSHPATGVNARAVAALARHGIQWEGRVPKSIDEVSGRPWDLLITVCDHANESCPFFPGTPPRVHWGLPDPAAVAGTDAMIDAAFESTWSELDRRVEVLLTLPLERMGREELEKAAQGIHIARTRT
ncbi:MAG: arsenate reductase ArsC [Gemmatimonadota bacterium]